MPSRWRPPCVSSSSTFKNASTPKLALLSDIHSNLEALEAVLGVMPPVDRILVLGDIVGYGPDPNGVIDRLRSVGARAVQGNHDYATHRPEILVQFNPDAAAALQWTRGQLTAENQRYLARLPLHGRVAGHRYVHGSPRRPYIWEYITDDLQALEILLKLGNRLCFFGHTHMPRIFTRDGEEVPPHAPRTDWLELPKSALVNPGSVGQPRDGHPEAAFALVDLDELAVQFHRVPYDVARTAAKIRAAGLPPIEAARLSHGR